MANPFVILAVASSFGKAYATYQAGMAQKAYYDSQAAVSQLQYKSKEIEAKEAGVEALKETNKALSSSFLLKSGEASAKEKVLLWIAVDGNSLINLLDVTFELFTSIVRDALLLFDIWSVYPLSLS